VPDQPHFQLVCYPSALAGAPAGWAAEMLREGEVALMAGEGIGPINEVAHALDQATIAVLRSEQTREAQDRTVMAHAGGLPLVWLAADFSDEVRSWAHDRGPMTLLVEASGPLPDEERRRIDRFVASLGRQSE
jgi:hypothetical protein